MANYNKKISDTGVRIGTVRFSYANVFTPRTNDDGKSKYSCAILIPKTSTQAVQMINEAIEAAKAKGKDTKWGGKIPANCKSPLRDGDEESDDPNYAGFWFINASSSTRPAVKILQDDGSKADALDDEDFYSGCYGVAVLNFFPYEARGNKGVGAGLNIVLKTSDGDKLGGGISADAALADI